MYEGRIDPFDVLRELSTIGAGNASGAISKLVGKKVSITVPDAYWIKVGELSQTPWITKSIVNIGVGIYGDRSGHVFLLLEKRDSLELVKLLMNLDIKEIGDLEISALMEVGNILTGTFIGALSRFLDIKIVESTPFLRVAPTQAVINDVVGKRSPDGEIWLAVIRFEVEGGAPKGRILFIPLFNFGRDAIEKLKK